MPPTQSPDQNYGNQVASELLSDESPEAEAGQGQNSAYQAASEHRRVGSNRHALEVHAPPQQRHGNDGKGFEQDARRESRNHHRGFGRMIQVCHLMPEQESEANEHPAEGEIEPEDRVRVFRFQMPGLNERQRQSLVEEQLQK